MFQELEAIKARVREMEEEAEKLKQMQSEVDRQMSTSSSVSAGGGVAGSPPGSNSSLLNLSFEEKMEVDGRSVFVGNVDYGATAEELEQHFHGCGSVQRVTILCNKFDGHPKGFAYVEFTDKDSVSTAMALDDSLFRGRQIKALLADIFCHCHIISLSYVSRLQVMPKRTNKPGITTSNRPPRGGGGARGGYRGRGFRGRGSFGAIRRPRLFFFLPHINYGIKMASLLPQVPRTRVLLLPVLRTSRNDYDGGTAAKDSQNEQRPATKKRLGRREKEGQKTAEEKKITE